MREREPKFNAIRQRSCFGMRPLVKCDMLKLSKDLSRECISCKIVAGHLINAAMYCWRDAYCEIIKTPLFRHKAKAAFKHVIDVHEKWERNLKHPVADHINFFDKNILEEESMKKYREDMTIDEFFEFWQSTGGEVYAKSAPQLKSLRYKFERILTNLGASHAKALSWVLLANAALSIADTIYTSCVNASEKNLPPLSTPFHFIMQDLSYKPVIDSWCKAVGLLNVNIAVDEIEDKDVETSYRDLINLWSNEIFLNQCTISAIDAYDTEILSSHGTARKLKHFVSDHNNKLREENFEARKKRILCDNSNPT